MAIAAEWRGGSDHTRSRETALKWPDRPPEECVKLFRGRQGWHHLSRFRFFLTIFRQLETIDLVHHFVGVNWPSATAVFNIFVDDSLQFFFFSVIKHNSKDKPLLKAVAHFWGVD